MSHAHHPSRPNISVVIPTYKRHDEVQRAVASVLAQTVPVDEILVVNDGQDRLKREICEQYDSVLVKFFEAPRRGSASATRNFGVRQASGDYIALLDDDDIWLPNKIEAQMQTLVSADMEEAILGGVERVLDSNGGVTKRPTTPVSAVPAGELLFRLGGINTSTILAPRWLFERIPFNEAIERHEDWEWLLRAGQEMPILIAPEVVCERRLRPGEGLSRSGGYGFTRAWYDRNRCWMSPRARAGFVAGILSRKAAYDRRLYALPWVIGETARNGRLDPRLFAQAVAPWILPVRVRRSLKRLIGSRTAG